MVITDASSERKDHMQKLVSALPSSSRNILTRVSVLHLVSDIDPEAPLQSSQVSSLLQLSLVRCHAATLRQNLLSLCFKDWGMAFYRVGNMLFYGRQLAVEKKEVYRFDEIESVHETMADGVGDDVRVLLSSNNSASETIKSGTYLVIRLAADQLYTLHTHANDASTFILQPKRAHPQPSIAPTSTPAPQSIPQATIPSDRLNRWLPPDTSKSVLFSSVKSPELTKLRHALELFFTNDDTVASQLDIFRTLLVQLKKYADELQPSFFPGVVGHDDLRTLYARLIVDMREASDRMRNASTAQLVLNELIHSVLPEATLKNARSQRQYQPYLPPKSYTRQVTTDTDWLGMTPFGTTATRRVVIGRTQEFRERGWQCPFADDFKIWETQGRGGQQGGSGAKRKRESRPRFGAGIDMVEF